MLPEVKYYAKIGLFKNILNLLNPLVNNSLRKCRASTVIIFAVIYNDIIISLFDYEYS